MLRDVAQVDVDVFGLASVDAGAAGRVRLIREAQLDPVDHRQRVKPLVPTLTPERMSAAASSADMILLRREGERTREELIAPRRMRNSARSDG